MTHFDFVNAISYTKEDLFINKNNISAYNSFMVNRGLSYFPDTVYAANEMNVNYNMDKDMQFNFLLNIVSKRKRFSKWEANNKILKEVEALSMLLNCSIRKAEEYITLLNDNQLKLLLQSTNKGGTK